MTKKQTILMTMIAASLFSGEALAQAHYPPGSHVVYADSFTGTTLNTQNWNTYMADAGGAGLGVAGAWFWNGAGGSAIGGNGSYDAEYDRPRNVHVSNGVLSLVASPQASVGPDGYHYTWQSGVISSQDKVEFTADISRSA